MAKRATLALLLLQMAGTMTPLVLFPQETFALAPIVPNLEGQYIIKNLVIISGALVIAATLRGAVLTQKALPGAAVRDEVGPDAGRGNLGQSCSDPKTVGC
jgi:hypothetical protein